MGIYVPPEWPAGVHPPGSEDFESTAVGWLLDVVPPDYRLHGVLRRYPVALATMARYHATACVEGARQGYRTARTELAGALPPHAIDTVLAAYRKEGARLAAIASGVDLIERALRGEVFVPEMGFAELPEPAGPDRNGQPVATRADTRAAHAQGAGTRVAGAKPGQKAAGAKGTDAKTAGVKTARARDADAAGARDTDTDADTAGARDTDADAAGARDADAVGGADAEGAGVRGAGRRQAGRSRRSG